MVALAFADLFAAFDCISPFHIFAFKAGELPRNYKRLGEKSLEFSGPRDYRLVLLSSIRRPPVLQ